MKLSRIKSALRRLFGTSSASYTKRDAMSLVAGEIKEANGGRSLVYLDIGSCGSRDPNWQWLLDQRLIEVIGVDMVDDWSRNPQKKNAETYRIKAAMGEENCERPVYITRHPACSSCLKPNFDLLVDYPVREWFDVVREEQVMINRYDDLSGKNSLPQPDIAKIDVQGFEGPVLRGMGSILDKVLCLEFECQLRELYCGQETFIDLYNFLIKKGYVLRDLRAQGPFEGEALEFNSFWSRKPKNVKESKIVKLWEIVNSISPGVDFKEIDSIQKNAYHFNQ